MKGCDTGLMPCYRNVKDIGKSVKKKWQFKSWNVCVCACDQQKETDRPGKNKSKVDCKKILGEDDMSLKVENAFCLK